MRLSVSAGTSSLRSWRRLHRRRRALLVVPPEHRSRRSRLLHDMRQLVRQKLPPLARGRREAAGAEDQILADREGVGSNALRRRGGLRIGMHPDAAEIMPEPRLEIGSCRGIERLAGRAQYLVDDGWRNNLSRLAGLDALCLEALMFPGSGFSRMAFEAPSAARTSALELRLCRAHHLLSHALCFLLVIIPRPVDGQFRLQCIRLRRSHGDPGEIVSRVKVTLYR